MKRCRLNSIGLLLALLFASGCEERSTLPAIETIPSPVSGESAEPHLARTADGRVILSWLERSAESTALRFSVLDGERWTPAQTIAASDGWFVNWADFPSVVATSDSLWAAHWLVKRPGGTYAYDIAIALSPDAGRTWGDPVTPHADGTATEHGFVSLFPWQSGVGAVWLDGRNMQAEDHGSDHGGGDGGMTLRSAVVNQDSTVVARQLIDDFVCDCCQTDVAIGRRGPIIVYRNRTQEEVRDIYVARADGTEWEAPTLVGHDGWEIAGCPVNGPAIAVADSTVVVAWFTAADDAPEVRLAFSNDDAKTFAEPITVDIDSPIGRVDVEALNDGTAIVSWIRGRSDDDGAIVVRRVATDGLRGSEFVVATTRTARLSGFPQMLRNDDVLVFAWTDATGDRPTVRTARVALEAL